jgi:glyoxylase-like metal-dependent hydrolase (beta-lactamase superfamily II)
LVVDTGMGIGSLTRSLPELFDGDPIVFLTHPHLDHAGGAHEFMTRWCHAATGPVLAEPEPETLVTAELSPSFADALAADDTSGTPPDYLIDSRPDDEYDAHAYAVAPAPATRLLNDGDVIDLGDRQFEAVHLPGHTPGSCALHDRANGVLFTGDVLYDGELLDELPESNRADYLASMVRLLDLELDVALPGHEQPLSRGDVHRIGRNYLTSRTA